MVEPGRRKRFAAAAGDEAAAAIAAFRPEAFLAIAPDDSRTRAPHKLDGCARVRAVSNDIAGTDQSLAANAAALGLLQQRAHRLQIAVRPPKYDGGCIELQQFGMFRTDRI